MSAHDWQTRAVCGCGYHTYVPFGDVVFVNPRVCPQCGEPSNRMAVKVMRWVDTARFLKPSTWGSGHWETKGEPLPTPTNRGL